MRPLGRSVDAVIEESNLSAESGGDDNGDAGQHELFKIDEPGSKQRPALLRDVTSVETALVKRDDSGAGPGGLKMSLLSRDSEMFLDMLDVGFFKPDHFDRTGAANGPNVTTKQLDDPKTLPSLLKLNPLELVGFKRFQRSKLEKAHTGIDKRLIRVKNASSLPLGVWARWVQSTTLYSQIVLWTILLNAVVLGVETLISEETHADAYRAFEAIEQISILIYCTEIVIKWIDSFWTFWNDGWNVFDFVVTILSVVPNIIRLSNPATASSSGGFTAQLRVFRTLRLLKMITKVRNLRIIMKTIIDAFASMGYTLLLLLVITFIFGIFSIYLFEKYTESNDPRLLYEEKFKNMAQSVITLFQLLTIDQWYNIERNVELVEPIYVTVPFFVVWIIVGAFVFRNVFVGVMVKNFHEVNQEFHRRVEEARMKKAMKRKLNLLNEALKESKKRAAAAAKGADPAASANPLPSVEADSSKADDTDAAKDERLKRAAADGEIDGDRMQENTEEMTEEMRKWEALIEQTLTSLPTKQSFHRWPRDAMFEYLRVMYLLQENLEEYNALQETAALAMSNLHDDAGVLYRCK